jgi:hypothetical protein
MKIKSILQLITLASILSFGCKKDGKLYIVLHGRVTDYHSGNAVPNAKLTIYNEDIGTGDTEVIGSCKTDQGGFYEKKVKRLKLNKSYLEYILSAPHYSSGVYGSNAIFLTQEKLESTMDIEMNLTMCY